MKILVVCQYYYPEPFRLKDICEALAASGHAVTVVTGTPNYPEGKIYPGYEKRARQNEVINGVTVHRCPLIPRGRNSVQLFLNYCSFTFSSSLYLPGVKDDFDVVFVYQLSPVMMARGALAWAKKNHKKCVLYCLDLWPENLTVRGIKRGSLVYRLFYHISRGLYRKADEILITTHSFSDYIRQTLRLPEKQITYLPQYAETLFDCIPPHEAHEGPYNFVYAGNIGDGQATETLIEAARILKDDARIRFHIVGGGSGLERCRRLAEGLENVTFYGRHDVEEMPAYYTMADAMVVTMPNNLNLDTLPGRVQSYLAAGRAVVASAGGETASVVREADCGLCAAAENAEELAARICELADAPERFGVFGKNAREYYQRTFQKDIFISKLLQALERNR